jgi:IrrE N-terminal-like domain
LAVIADRLATEVLKATGVPPTPPVPVDIIARALGVDDIVEAGMIEEGRLELSQDATRIILNQQVGMARKRFTLCHELGHLILARPGDTFTAYRSLAPPDREERFCDQFAAALLMPYPWVQTCFGRSPECLATAKLFARQAGVSLSASVVRLQEVAGWSRSLLHWRRIQGRWRLTSMAGVPVGHRNRVASIEETRRILDSLCVGDAEPREGMLPLAVGGADTSVPVEISVRKTSAVALASFRPGAQVA